MGARSQPAGSATSTMCALLPAVAELERAESWRAMERIAPTHVVASDADDHT